MTDTVTLAVSLVTEMFPTEKLLTVPLPVSNPWAVVVYKSWVKGWPFDAVKFVSRYEYADV